MKSRTRENFDELSNSKNYTVWENKKEQMIFLRDRSHPDQKEHGDSRSPDLFFGSVEDMKELMNALRRAIGKKVK